MGADTVRFFYDQILVKEPGTPNRTPWHQDLPYYPLSGEQIVSLWVAIDEATPQNGVVTYVRGSHRWGRFFEMQAFGKSYEKRVESQAREGAGVYVHDDGRPRTLRDIRDHPENYDLVAWSVEPGDCLVHHALTVHGADGNSSQTRRRRAIATRWLGEDVRWDDSRPNFVRALRGMKDFPAPQLKQGDVVDDPLFPVVWERRAAHA
jgi:ectoine hydroxylase-related dioxygenase (phytanoyl-CoA dioxygenase family)